MAGWKMDLLKMYSLLKWGFSIAMLVYWRVHRTSYSFNCEAPCPFGTLLSLFSIPRWLEFMYIGQCWPIFGGRMFSILRAIEAPYYLGKKIQQSDDSNIFVHRRRVSSLKWGLSISSLVYSTIYGLMVLLLYSSLHRSFLWLLCQ